MVNKLDDLGLADIKEVYHNISYDELFTHENQNNEGKVTNNGFNNKES